MTTKTIDTLVDDIYELFTDEHPKVLNTEALEQMGKAVARVVQEQIEGKPENKDFRLRPSNIGGHPRQLYFQSKDPDFNKISPEQSIRFLLGHILEQLVVFLIKESGHSVTDEQAPVTKYGLVGSLDLRVDGQLVDIKSASTFGFSKFAKNRVVDEDTWGYPEQMRFYSSETDKKVYWLAVDKQHGTLALADTFVQRLPPIKSKIKTLVDALEAPTPDALPLCAEPVAEENGNEKLPKICGWCKYKHNCYPNVRTFVYKKGNTVEYQDFVKVVKEPRVTEVTRKKVD